MQYEKVELKSTSALSFGIWSPGSKDDKEARSGKEKISKAISNVSYQLDQSK
jgi:hypothetical protein